MTNVSVSIDECIAWFGYPSIGAVPDVDFVYYPGPRCYERCHTLADELQQKWAFRYNVVLNDVFPPETYPLDRLAALIKLDDYDSYNSFINYVKGFSDGERLRLVRRAADMGYFVEQFPLGLFAADRYEIHHSKEVRQGRTIDGNLLLTIDDMNGPSDQQGSFTNYPCIHFSQQAFGVFLPDPGRMQGKVVIDKKLVAYIVVYCTGNVGSYIWIVGHSQHVANEIMDLCHHHVMKLLLNNRPAWATKLDFVRYAGMEDGLTGLFQWKRRAGFRPYRCYAKQQELNCN